ncbi:MAG: UDP-N-acetylmuramoyl-tripeptide--D-alanyl-D-alanine ligase [Flavobacterium sp.]|nr:MAG: UDP-N-acetylmuramoyl-tripeptide--D-alanyl-D-alanine ligase [Flavobacterium sp.]
MKIETLHHHFLQSSGICTDTRKITPNCLFFALKGENFNGNRFAQEALDKGAFKVVIDDISAHKNTGETILHGNSLVLLQKLATYHRNYLNVPIIALTGSNGKTTTKELINSVLSQKFCTTATIGNLNNHIGVPLTLLSMDKETELGIVEMGANHLNEIAQLSAIVQPDYGYITNFGKAHLEGFGSEEGVIKGKSELYKYLSDNEKLVFVNGNDEKQMALTGDMERFTFGSGDFMCSVILKDASGYLRLEYQGITIQSNLIGLYNFHNIASAIAIGQFFNVSEEHIKTAIEGYTPQNNRSQIIEKDGFHIILDAYNANPTSMLAALENFQQAKGANKFLILGDMFELGEHAAAEHQKIVTYLEQHPFARAYLIGENFHKTHNTSSNVKLFKDFENFRTFWRSEHFKGGDLLVKGSRGMALERIMDLL